MLVLHNIHGDTPFPSDFVTTLFALDAEVEYYEIVLQPDGSAQAVKQSSTLEAMVQKIVANPPPSEQSQNLRRYILMSYSVPLSKDNGVVLSQKVALREVNSHAIVNAATNLSFGDGLNVATARLIFGNIASFPWRASRTESALQGNELSLDLISKLCSILDEEVRAALAQWQDAFANVPDEGFTDNYKASSAVSMFYKAMLNALVKRGGKVPPHLESAGNEYWGNWPSSTGRQYYTVQDFKKPVSQPYIKGTALAQCSGQTHYTQEIAPPPRTLYAGVVQANAALGKAAFKRPGDLDATLTMDDLSEYLREQFPEFVSIISYSDIPKYGVNYQGIGLDQPLFADAIVLYVGQCLGLLIAETEEAALRITRLVNEQCVDVTQAEWDQPWNLPVLTLEDAIDRGSIFPDSPATAPWVMHVWKITRPHSQFDWMATEDGAPRHPDIVVAEHIDVGGISCTRIANSQRTGGQAHFYMETQAALAIPSDEGRMVVHSSTQSPLEIQQSVAMALSSHYNKVKIQTALLGGGFGGKTEQTRFVAAPTAVAARVLNRPVRLIVPRDQDTALIGKRHALYGECQIAVDDGTVDNKNKGLIRGLHLTMWADGGAYYDCSYIVSNCIQTRIDNAYMIPNFESQIDVCRTNTAPNTAMRSFGDIQGKTVLENAIDDAAAQLGIRPEEIREKNFYVRGDMAPYGQVLTACYIKEVWAYLKEKCDYDKKVSDVEDFNSKNKWRKRGISMIPVKYGSGYNFEQLKQSTAIIVANQADGSIVIHQGGVEMGQGLLTQVQQVAAYVLNIPLDLIHVESPQTDTTPNTTSSGASTGTPYSCEAVKRTAEILRKRLMDFGYQLLKDNGDDWCKAHGIDFWNYGLQGWAAEVSPPNMAPALIWQNIVNLAYVYRLGLTATFNIDIPQGDFDMPVLGFKPADKQPQIPGITPSSTDPSGVLNQFVGYTYSAACSVVEIDVLTGETKILSSDIVYDMGWSLNPALDIGQVEGAFIQGVGYLLTEELVTQSKPIAANYREGKLNTVNTWRYKIPAHVTIPLEMNVYLFPRNDPSVINIPPDDQGIFSAKEVGEPPLVLAISVFFAVKDAVRASRKERGKLALFRLDAPATPQEVRRACDVTLSDL
ncbi:Xanthine dehydrogenase molybdenum-binding subunit [Sphingomonas haloaromaticamans]|uniref:Xanthine dehydrogenase molybdenum-binding subunit n=2 Tax=Alphaproteobacteria TaxID=28211 RepID=A0A1S1H8X7_9SPHN|nr:Xanthine dehydrogenase molybdenum-binding subunit [Sphingomonas haloaromaticamans]